MSDSNSTASKRLKFRLEVTIDNAGAIAAADLRVRDGDTRVQTSLGGWPVPTEGADIGRLVDTIKRVIENTQADQAKIARYLARVSEEKRDG